jgi:hypothetical protein
LYKYSVVAFGLALSHWAEPVRINDMIYICLHRSGSSWPRWEPVWQIFEHAFKFRSKENLGKACATLPGASACKHWQEFREQRCRERLTGKGSARQEKHFTIRKVKLFRCFNWKTRRGF